ncbi:MAG: stage II sporulation protein M [Candidatus Woesearchaeota archaeon]
MLEQYFKLQWIEKKEHSFFLGLGYTLISILAAYLILPSFTGIASIGLTTALLLPSLNALLKEEENVEIREKKLSPTLLFKDHIDIIKVYFFVFFGVFTAYIAIPLIFGVQFATRYFSDLLHLTGMVGSASSPDVFLIILQNNLIVLFAVFALSLIYGAGSIFYLTINAATWGMFFGVVFLLQQTQSFFIQLLTVLPHTILEGLGYILIAIAGGVLSKAVIREKIGSTKFYHVVVDSAIIGTLAILTIIIAALVEVLAFNLM